MRVLIAILSCHRDRQAGYDEAQREFLNEFMARGDLDFEYRFFVGGLMPADLRPDEVYLEVGDSYEDLPFKTQAICRWALDSGYDYIFKCDTDTYIHVPRLLKSGFEHYQYMGYYRGLAAEPSYASGGSGYWLNREAMLLVSEAEMSKDFLHEEVWRGYWNGEDVQVGRILKASGIHCWWDDRYRLDETIPSHHNDAITNHSVKFPNRGDQMRLVHAKSKRYMRSNYDKE